MTLIELALTTYTEYEAQVPLQAAEMLAQAREEFLALVRDSVGRALCADAEKLDWQYTPSEGLPEEVEEATARLELGRPEYLRYRADHGKDIWALELVRPCDACGTDRIDQVQDLVHLGRLLAEGTGVRR